MISGLKAFLEHGIPLNLTADKHRGLSLLTIILIPGFTSLLPNQKGIINERTKIINNLVLVSCSQEHLIGMERL